MLDNAPICYVFLYVRDLGQSRQQFEDKLGFDPIESDADAVKYRAGQTMLALNLAEGFGIDLSQPRTQSLIVFHSYDVTAAAKSLRERSVEIGDIDRYEIGATVEVKNFEQHGLMLYEPSADALTWPSAAKIREVMGVDPPEARPVEYTAKYFFGLGTRPLLYVFQFVRDAAEAAEFYQQQLGLKVLETDDSVGVVKYDGGTFILATHAENHLGARGDPPRTSGMACVFLVDDVRRQAVTLKNRGVAVGAVSTSEIGNIARFTDPNGHAYFLYEPSKASLDWPSGAVLRELSSQFVRGRT
jgi:catechol 2,3-dioxygenase-like lactoylglutathione lyase family enzyme